MTELEEKVENLEGKYSDLHTVVNVLAAKVDATNNKVDNLISEMRDRDNRRADEIAELRKETDDKVARIEAKVDSTNKYISNFFYTSLAAIGAMLLTVLYNLPKG